MDEGVIESQSIPAVASLRSKFEQLAVETSPSSKLAANAQQQQLYLAPRMPTSPRPRASSGTFNTEASSLPHQLRSSSSSSDLQVKLKRPPPPPPPRGTNTAAAAVAPASPSPLSSPLLRPVPAPPVPAASFGSLVNTGGSPTRPKPPTPPISPARRGRLLLADTAASPNTLSPRQSPIQISQSTSFGSDPFATRLSDTTPHSRSSSSISASGNSLFSTDHTVDSDSDSSLGSSLLAATPTRPPPRIIETTDTGEDVSVVAKPMPPPRPPPRHRATIVAPIESQYQTHHMPPPLPSRRPTASPSLPNLAPPLPSRPSLINVTDEDTPKIEKRIGRLPPPPKRTIGPTEKLPEPRRRASSEESSSDEEDVEDVRDQLPDRSQTSRRAPVCGFLPDPKFVISGTEHHTVICGTYVAVAGVHHLRVYDSRSPIPSHPIYTLDVKELGLAKDAKLTCVGLAYSDPLGEGQYIWVGSSTGCLCEIELHTRSLTGIKRSAHAGSVTSIFKCGANMVTMDEAGKTLIFSMEALDSRLTQTYQPRVLRMTDKHDFAQLVRGKLWVAYRGDFTMSLSGGRVPLIRIYNVFHPGSPTATVMPSEKVGVVTGLTIVQSMPGFAYMSHEEGYISVWSLDTDDGVPACVEVTRIQISDVTSVTGVCDKLWVGSRSGSISVIDISSKPWIVTNQWDTSKNLPVLELLVDWEGVGKHGNELMVASVGRSGEVKLWDGLLSADCIDRRLVKREAEFSTFRDIKLLVVSWNVDAAKPQDLNGDPANLSFLSDVLASEDAPDIISFGFQEVIDLESRKMAAKSVIMQGKRKSDEGALSDHVTGAYKRWYERLIPAVRMAMPPETPYHVIHTESMVGLFTCIFVKSKERVLLKDIATKTVKRGMGGRYGNKGGILARFVIDDSSICLINCHLAAGQGAIRQRNADIASFLESKDVFPQSEEPGGYVDGGNGEMVLDHDIVVISGDMNYRIDQRRETAINNIHNNDFESLLPHDQLLKEMKFNRGFRLRGFSEGPITFPPTYKYDRRSNTYDTSEKSRTPAWCDRILWHSRLKNRVEQSHYRRYEANVSDHRPISAGFKVKIKNVRHEVRERLKNEEMIVWANEKTRVLESARAFYTGQLLSY